MDGRTLAASGNDVKTLLVIHDFIQEHGYSPSVRDVMSSLETNSTSVTNYRLAYLVKMGWIRRQSEIARSIVITEEGKKVIDAKKKH